MAQVIKPTQSQEYHEKIQYHTELPPTPSSSAFSFLVSDQKEESEKYSIEEDKKPLNTTMPTTTNYYGSINSESIYSFGQSSSAASTISPNDDDEGLYLLWTHQILREKGFKPSSCRLEDNEDDNNDNESTDSSITDLSYNNKPVSHGQSSTFSFFKLLSRNQNNNNNSQSSSWLSCFPMC